MYNKYCNRDNNTELCIYVWYHKIISKKKKPSVYYDDDDYNGGHIHYFMIIMMSMIIIIKHIYIYRERERSSKTGHNQLI